MKRYIKIWFGIGLAIVVVVGLTIAALRGHSVAVLQPAGQVAHSERNLIILCSALSVTIVIPVFGLLGYFAWKYREGNTHAKYTPELGGSKLAESVWWLVPTMLIAIISTVTWQSSYALDPFKPLVSNKPVLHVQVVALDWKWLFIYPQQNIASVNEAAIPVGTPVDFEITSDAVMTSFWAPQLGGQMYAMPGMDTQLNLQAAKPGNYRGVAANISGKGFAGMKFTIKATSDQGFAAWTKRAKQASGQLTTTSYSKLAAPSENVKPAYYGSVDPVLYDTIVMKYMEPLSGSSTDGAVH